MQPSTLKRKVNREEHDQVTRSVDSVDVSWRQRLKGLAKRRSVVAKDLPKRLK